MKYYIIPALLITLFVSTPSFSSDAVKEFTISIKDHTFSPSELKIPAGEKVKLIVDNQDTTPEEFESHELGREKVISGGKKATIFVGPLKAGTYPFFGEFNPKTAQGKIIAE